MRVKICGVNSPAAFDAAAEAGADWIGFVFHPRSPRAVTPGLATLLSRRLAGGPARVGLFVDPSDDDIAAALDCLELAALQLYAPPSRVAEIARVFGVPVWRSLPVTTAAELPDDAAPAAALVIEPPPPPHAVRPGGNATALDWKMLAGWLPASPWLLAGGLTPWNVALAVAESGAVAVDVSSGVETAPGVKDPDLIAAFVAAAHSTASHAARRSAAAR